MSITPATVRLYTTLWEGDVVERVTYQLYNRNITIDKLPRTLLEKYKNEEELHFSGIYFLTNSSANDPRLYVGQAAKRLNGNGLIGRIREHDRSKDFWDTAYLITSTDNSWEATELNYLESAFCREAQKVGRYRLENGIIPFAGNIAKVKKAILRSLVLEVLLMLRASGHRMFEPITPKKAKSTGTEATANAPADDSSTISQPEEAQLPAALADAVFRIKRKELKHPARARIVNISGTRVGVEVFEGELLPVRAPKKAEARYLKDLEALEATRAEQVAAGHLDGLKIVKPIEFTSQSAASKFVVGSASNGNTDWVLESDPSVSLGAFLQNLEDSQS